MSTQLNGLIDSAHYDAAVGRRKTGGVETAVGLVRVGDAAAACLATFIGDRTYRLGTRAAEHTTAS